MKIVIAIILAASAAFAQKATPDFANIAYGPAAAQILDIYQPTAIPGKANPVVVWVHGGAWSGGDKNSAAQAVTWLKPEGFAIVSINYRLSGVATYPAQINDCKGAIRWIKAQAATYNFDTNRIGVWGSSAGGHLVALLGTTGDVGVQTIDTVSMDIEGSTGGNLGFTSRVHAVCDWYGPTDFLEIWKYPSSLDHDAPNSPESLLLGSPMLTVPERCTLANPITYISPDDPPMLIMHGTKDNTVPFNQSVIFDSALRVTYEPLGQEVSFYPIVDAGHGGGGFTVDSTKQRVVAFFNKHLKAGTQDVSIVADDNNTRLTLTSKAVVVAGPAILDKIEVVDLLGRIQYTTTPTAQEVKIATTHFASGTYFLITYEKGRMFAYKFKL